MTSVNNEADRPPNWGKWRLIPNPELWQCIALSLNIDPDKVRRGSIYRMAGDRIFDESQEFKDRMDVALANLSSTGSLHPKSMAMGSPSHWTLSLRQFAAWVRQIGRNVPPELLTMADEHDLGKQRTPTSAEGNAIVEPRAHNKRETEARNRKWQERIAALARDHPGTSHADLCRRLAKEIGVPSQTIRRNTRLLHS